jgi:hypothetical protein
VNALGILLVSYFPRYLSLTLAPIIPAELCEYAVAEGMVQVSTGIHDVADRLVRDLANVRQKPFGLPGADQGIHHQDGVLADHDARIGRVAVGR